MQIGLNPLTFAFGHQWGAVNPQRSFIGENLNMRTNLAKGLGYIPVLSMVIGALRFIGLLEKEHFKRRYPSLALDYQQQEDAATIRVAFRAVFELLSFSVFLMAMDLLADIIRLRRSERTSRSSYRWH